MDWKSHMLVPLFVYIAVILLLQPSIEFSLQALFLLLFSSFFPDLDHPKSVMRKMTFIIVFYLMVFAVTVNIAVELWLKFVIITIMLVLASHLYRHLPLKHRGKRSFHLWRYFFIFPTIFIFAFVVAGLSIQLVAFVFAGYGLHLAVDKKRKF
jgi:hypothetical protein